jgi:hypothetical protein
MIRASRSTAGGLRDARHQYLPFLTEPPRAKPKVFLTLLIKSSVFGPFSILPIIARLRPSAALALPWPFVSACEGRWERGVPIVSVRTLPDELLGDDVAGFLSTAARDVLASPFRPPTARGDDMLELGPLDGGDGVADLLPTAARDVLPSSAPAARGDVALELGPLDGVAGLLLMSAGGRGGVGGDLLPASAGRRGGVGGDLDFALSSSFVRVW